MVAAPKSEASQTETLEKLPIGELLTKLGVQSDHGLSAAEAEKRLAQYGPNAIVEKEESLAAKIIGYFSGPIAYIIEAAAVVSAVIGHWEDFAIITALLSFNAGLEFSQDRQVSAALAALKKRLAPEAIALRDAKWQTVQATTLVPGDIVRIRLGAIVPADLRLVNGDYASIDQAALTGEPVPVSKKVGDEAYSGSDVVAKVKTTVDDLASKGSRALGVARSQDDGTTWELLGILPMFDPRDDSKATIGKAREKGVHVKMITGYDTAIAIETARLLGRFADYRTLRHRKSVAIVNQSLQLALR